MADRLLKKRRRLLNKSEELAKRIDKCIAKAEKLMGVEW